MRKFGYGLDPLCWGSIALYATNRWWLKPRIGPGFFHDHFNDLLLIPAALPLVLWLHRKLGWRTNDSVPTPGEIFLHLAVWGIICEVVGPIFVQHATADWRDAVAYACGALIAGTYWRFSPAYAQLQS